MENKAGDIDEILNNLRSKSAKAVIEKGAPIFAKEPSSTSRLRDDISSSGFLSIQSEQLAAQIVDAESRPLVWTTTPDTRHYNGFTRSVANVVGKIFLYFAQVVTKPQQAFNLSMMQTIHRINENLHILQHNNNWLLGRLQEMESKTAELSSHLTEFRILNKKFMYLEAKNETLEGKLEFLKGTNAQFADTVSGLKPEMAMIREQLTRLMTTMLNQERRLAVLLEEARTRFPDPFDNAQLKIFANELEAIEEELYLSFEDKYRGTREEIQERVKVYLPLMQKARAGERLSPILDVGCGRGEWLEVLKNAGMTAYGVDSSKTMVERCRATGLKAEQGDVLGYLKQIKDESLGAVTGHHIIEHLPFKVWKQMLVEVYRVLKHGGVMIFETPNPENVVVGSNTFYLDPTHIHPLPSELVQFVAAKQGFSKVEILRLHPFDEYEKVADTNGASGRINQLVYGPRDYALIAWKA